MTNRVRKARRAASLACGHYVNVGHIIVRRDGRWICLECALAAIKTSAGNRSAAAPSTKENTMTMTVEFTSEELRKLHGFLYGTDFSDQPAFQSAIDKLTAAVKIEGDVTAKITDAFTLTEVSVLSIIMHKLLLGHDTEEFMRLSEAADWTTRPAFGRALAKIDAARAYYAATWTPPELDDDDNES